MTFFLFSLKLFNLSVRKLKCEKLEEKKNEIMNYEFWWNMNFEKMFLKLYIR